MFWGHCKHGVSEHWTVVPGGGTVRTLWASLVTPFLSSNQYIPLFCVFLFKDTYIICTIDLLTLHWYAQLRNLCLNNFIFHRFLCRGRLDSTMLGSYFKDQNHQQKAQKCEKFLTWHWIDCNNDTYLQCESSHKKASPCSTSAGNMLVKQYQIFCHSMHICKWPESTLSIDLGNNRQRVGKFANMETVNNEDQLYLGPQ